MAASPSSSVGPTTTNEKERVLNQTSQVQDQPRFKSDLEEFERDSSTRPPWILTYTEVKLLGIAGVSGSIAFLVVCTEIDRVPGFRSAFSSMVSSTGLLTAKLTGSHSRSL